MLRHWIRSIIWSNILIRYNATTQIRGITSSLLNVFWLWIWTTLKRGNDLVSIMGLRCYQAHIILEFILGMTNPNVIGSKTDREMGEQHSRTQKNSREISSEELRCGVLCGPIGVDLSPTREEGYRKGIHGDGKFLQETFLPHSFFGKPKIPSNRSSSK